MSIESAMRDIELLTDSERAALLQGLRFKRLAHAAQMGPLYGEAFASALRTLGMDSDADKVEEMVKSIHKLTLEVA